MAMVVDPVCGMRTESEEAAGTMEYEGKTYYFCSQTCHDAFVAVIRARTRSDTPFPFGVSSAHTASAGYG